MQVLETLPWKIVPPVTESALPKSGLNPGAKEKKTEDRNPSSSKLWTFTQVCVILVSYTLLRAPAAPKSLLPPAGAFPLNPKGTLESEGLRMAQIKSWLKGFQFTAIQSIDYTRGLKPILGLSQNRC